MEFKGNVVGFIYLTVLPRVMVWMFWGNCPEYSRNVQLHERYFSVYPDGCNIFKYMKWWPSTGPRMVTALGSSPGYNMGWSIEKPCCKLQPTIHGDLWAIWDILRVNHMAKWMAAGMRKIASFTTFFFASWTWRPTKQLENCQDWQDILSFL